MPGTESYLPADWFAQGNNDIQAAEILLKQNGPLRIVAFHIQQAVEKYLKGFLLAQGWTLRRIHDLEVLIRETITYDDDFESFLPMCQKITEYYIETRYPLGIYSSLDQNSLESDLATVRHLINLIQSKVFPNGPKEDTSP